MYELTWQDGHTGLRSREVETVAQLREVVAWARANPRVRRWSFHPYDRLVGELATRCRHGHLLQTYTTWYRTSGWLVCGSCGGHHLIICQDCGDRVIDPVPGPDCGPPA